MKKNSYQYFKEVLDNLEDSKVGDIIKDLKDLLHSRARSTITENDIKDIINKYSEQ